MVRPPRPYGACRKNGPSSRTSRRRLYWSRGRSFRRTSPGSGSSCSSGKYVAVVGRGCGLFGAKLRLGALLCAGFDDAGALMWQR